VVFVGEGYARRHELLAPLREFGLHIWGPGWEPLADCVRARRLPAAETAGVYAAAGVVVNCNHPQSITGTNARTYEAPGAGALLITDDKPAVRAQFAAGRELVIYRDGGELRERVAHYLAHPDEAAAIAAAGQRRVAAEHTYAQRLRELLARVAD